jgi:hypothetical protein
MGTNTCPAGNPPGGELAAGTVIGEGPSGRRPGNGTFGGSPAKAALPARQTAIDPSILRRMAILPKGFETTTAQSTGPAGVIVVVPIIGKPRKSTAPIPS